jgi:hypothetical protein
MLISEKKLRKIIRNKLLLEDYVPKKPYEEVLYYKKGLEQNKNAHKKLQYLGSPGKGAYYFKNLSNLKLGNEIPANEFNSVLDSIKKLYGKDITSSHKAKLKKALENSRIVKLTDTASFHDPVKYQGATTGDYVDMGYDIVADTVGAAAGLFGAQGIMLGAKVNASQAAKKYIQEKYVDGTISALGALPIPGAQQAIGPGLKNLSLMKSLAKGGKELIKKTFPNLASLIKGFNDLIDTIKSKKEIFLTFIKENILPIAKITTVGVVMPKIKDAIAKIIKDIQTIIDSLK